MTKPQGEKQGGLPPGECLEDGTPLIVGRSQYYGVVQRLHLAESERDLLKAKLEKAEAALRAIASTEIDEYAPWQMSRIARDALAAVSPVVKEKK